MQRKDPLKPANLDGSSKSTKKKKSKILLMKDNETRKNVEVCDPAKKKSKRTPEGHKKKVNDADDSAKKKKKPCLKVKKNESFDESGKKLKKAKVERKKKKDDGAPIKKKDEKDNIDGSEKKGKKDVEERKGSNKENKKESDRAKKEKEAKDKSKEREVLPGSERASKPKSPPHVLLTPIVTSHLSQPQSSVPTSPNPSPCVLASTSPHVISPVPPIEDDSDEDEESSGGKTPPNTPEPNEGPSDAFELENTATSKSLDLATKGDVLIIGGIKLIVQEALKGNYGMGIALTKEVEKKIDAITAGAQVNLKYEHHSAKIKRLMIETEIIKHAHINQKSCVPLFIEGGEHNSFNCLIVDGMGPPLSDLIEKLNGFTPSTIFKIALITIDLLRIFHSMLYLHRDIRPCIFHVGKEGHRNRIIIGSISCARKYGIRKEVEPEEKCDLEIRKPKFRTKVWHPRKKVLFIGSVKYAPRSSHLNREHTRRDDVESWFYMIYEFLNKSLPWKNITERDKIYEIKNEFLQDQKFSDDVQRKFGPEMVNICEYFGVQNYFEMEPDYTYIELCILNMLKDANKNSSNDKFDWEQQPSVFDKHTFTVGGDKEKSKGQS